MGSATISSRRSSICRWSVLNWKSTSSQRSTAWNRAWPMSASMDVRIRCACDRRRARFVFKVLSMALCAPARPQKVPFCLCFVEAIGSIWAPSSTGF